MENKCKGCRAIIPPENATSCQLCKTEEEDKCVPLFCKRCTKKCHKCKAKGCKDCVEVACCDCGIRLCVNCTGDDNILCDCYGECSICGTDINRSEDGWPCAACNIWYCNGCRSDSENQCTECGPKDDDNN
jgi:hypothetical protein